MPLTHQQMRGLATHLGIDGVDDEGDFVFTETPSEFAEWAWRFTALGPFVTHAAVTTAVRLAVPVFEAYRPVDRWDREAFDGPNLPEALDALGRTPRPGDAQRRVLDAVNGALEHLGLHIREANGSAELVDRRWRAFDAARAVYLALAAACWTEDDVPSNLELVERTAQIEAGPALLVVQCLASVCSATELSRHHLIRMLAREHLDPVAIATSA